MTKNFDHCEIVVKILDSNFFFYFVCHCCNIKTNILNSNNFYICHLIEAFASFNIYAQIHIKSCEDCINNMFVIYFVRNTLVASKIALEILSYNSWFDSHVCWEVKIIWFVATSKSSFFFAEIWRSFIYHLSITNHHLLFVCNQSEDIDWSKFEKFKIEEFSATYVCEIAFALSFCFVRKLIFSSYKKSNFFHISLQSRFSFAWSLTSSSYFWSFHTFSSLFESSLSNLHLCCICFNRFNFRHDLFYYRRFNQQHSSNRRSIEEMR